MNLSKHAKELEEFEKLSNYVDSVLNSFKSIKDADRNDLYELYYIQKELQGRLSKEIENKTIKNNTQSILDSVTLIINSLSDNDVKEIMERKVKTSKVEGINKKKYGKKNKFDGLTDKSKNKIVENNKIMQYILGPGSTKVVTMLICFGILTLIPIIKSAKITVGESLQNIEETLTEANKAVKEDQTVEEIIAEGKVTVSEVKKETTNVYSRMLEFALTITLTVVSIFLMLSVLIDLIKLTIPAFSMIDSFNRLASQEANEIFCSDSIKELPYKVDTNDRIEIARALLNNLIEEYSKYEAVIKNKDYLKIAKSLKKELLNSKNRTLVINSVNAEYLYNEVMDSYNNSVGEMYKTLSNSMFMKTRNIE